MTTWDILKKGGSITLSNGDLTYSGGGVGQVLSTEGKASGKWYLEFHIDSNNGSSVVGAANSSSNINSYTGSDTNSWGYYSGGGVYHGSSSGSQSSYGAGDTIGMALDMDNLTIQFYRNGVATGGLVTGLSTTMFAAGGAGGAGNGATVNFGSTAFAYTPPSGFLTYNEAGAGPIIRPTTLVGNFYKSNNRYAKPLVLKTAKQATNVLKVKDLGTGIISGTVKEAGSPDYPVARKIRLHRKSDGALLREKFSDDSGNYAFTELKIQMYYVVAFDHTGVYNAVIKDFVTPDPMP